VHINKSLQTSKETANPVYKLSRQKSAPGCMGEHRMRNETVQPRSIKYYTRSLVPGLFPELNCVTRLHGDEDAARRSIRCWPSLGLCKVYAHRKTSNTV